MDYNSIALNRIFIQSTLEELLEDPAISRPYSAVITRFINNPEDKNNGEILSEIYAYLSKNYRNEYFYKNTLLNKLLLGVHKPTSTTALTEIPIGKSKADFILINGKAVVYEIKTALDTFDRLETQLSDYYKAFDHVAVLTDFKNQAAITDLLSGSPVGIYLMTKRNQLCTIRAPAPHRGALDSGEIFKVMNKSEYEAILLQFYGSLPDVPPVKYYQECKRLFCEIDITHSYNAFLKQLKQRNRIILTAYKQVPYELKALIYFSHYQQADYDNLQVFLNQPYVR